jgi:transforming growth factor-beta-induced protein
MSRVRANALIVGGRLAVGVAVVLIPAAAAGAAEQDIVDTAVAAGQFKTLVAAVKAAGLVETLKGKGPLTVFAPTDAAFAKLPNGTLASLLKPENKARLTAILTYHVVAGKLMAADVVKARQLATLQGAGLAVRSGDDGVLVDGAKVVTTNIAASNGVIHVIDTVVLPRDIVETAEAAGQFKTLLAALKAAGLTDTLKGEGPFTVFAPTDEAFAKLPAGTLESLLKPENKANLTSILTYHVVPGRLTLRERVLKTVEGSEATLRVRGRMMINGARVTTADILVSNGVVHVIDAVILPGD